MTHLLPVSTHVYLRVGAVEPFSTHTLSRLLRAFTQEATDRYHPDISNGFLSRFCFEKQPQVTPSSPPPPVRRNKGAMASPARLPSPVCARACVHVYVTLWRDRTCIPSLHQTHHTFVCSPRLNCTQHLTKCERCRLVKCIYDKC